MKEPKFFTFEEWKNNNSDIKCYNCKRSLSSKSCVTIDHDKILRIKYEDQKELDLMKWNNHHDKLKQGMMERTKGFDIFKKQHNINND